MKPIAPDKTQMEAYLRRGLSQRQIAEQYEQDTGIRVARATIGMAMSRFGLASAYPKHATRYEDTIPWKLEREHRMATEARLLRMEGRRRRGIELTPKEEQYWKNWRRGLKEKNAVVNYTPELGFHWVERRPEDVDPVVRRPDEEEKAS